MIFSPWKPAVLDEDCAGLPAGDRAAGDEQIGHVRLERLGIELGHERLGIAADTRLAHQIDVSVIPSQQENAVGRNGVALPLGVLDNDRCRRDLRNARLETRCH